MTDKNIKTRLIGYARVSSATQNNSLKEQVETLKEYGYFKVFEDVCNHLF